MRGDNKVCDYASSAASQPSPPADEIAGWISESDGLITQASVSLQGRDKEVAARTELLDSDITRLRTILDNLSSPRLAILADLNRLEQIKSSLDEAEKDLKRAEEIKANYLNTYVSEMERIQGGRDNDVKGLGKDADVLAQAVRGKDRQLEAGVAQLQARIEAAANIVRMKVLYQRPPEVPELGPEFHEFRVKLEGLDEKKAGLEEGFGLVNPAIADAQKAISDAEGAVVAGASATKNAPANIQRARQCYAALKGEPQEDGDDDKGSLAEYRSQLKALTARTGKIEASIPEFEREKAEYKAKWEEEKLTMKLHIAAAMKAYKEAAAVEEIIGGIALTVDYIREKLAEAKGIKGRVQEKTASLNLVYSSYADAAKEASTVADKVCDYANRAVSQPSPTDDEVAGWISESDGLITRISISVLAADKEVNAQIESLESYIPTVKSMLTSLEEFLSRRDAILANFDRLKQIKNDLDNAEKSVKRVAETMAKYIKTSPSEMKIIYGGRRKKIMDLQEEVDVLAQAVSGKDQQLEADVAGLQDRIKAADAKVMFTMSSVPPEAPKLSPAFYAMQNRLKGLDEKKAEFEKGFGIVNSAIADIKKAISDAESVVVAGAFAAKNAPKNIQRARQCYASLKNAKDAIQKMDEKLYAYAKAALNSCDFEGARTLIDQMPAGPKRAKLDQKYQASVSLEDRLKALVNKANGKYKSRNYEAALSTLKGALDEAKCERHRKSINKKIARVNATVLKVYNNAKASLNSCDFEGARKFIDLIPAGPKRAELDQEHQASISLENRLKALVGKANGEYGSRNYKAALSTLKGALDEAKCDRHIESINDKIAKVMGKMGPVPEEQVAATVPPVRGENVEIAKMIIRDAKMVPSVNRKKRTSNENEVDKVYDQNPSAGSPATQGDTIIIYVFSKAKGEIIPPPDDEEIITVDWEILKVDKYCSFTGIWDTNYRESDAYWALFERPQSKDEVFLGPSLEANRYFQYLIVQFSKEYRNKSLRRNDPPPHEDYARYYRKDNNKSIRVVAVAETRAEIERLRDQQWSTRDRETVKESEKRLENLLKRIEQRMESEGALRGVSQDERIFKALERMGQDIQTGKLRINLLENGVVVDTVTGFLK